MAEGQKSGGTHASTEVATHGPEAPLAFYLNPAWFVGLSMAVVVAIFLWKKVPGAIGRALDSKIAQIRDQLAEAEALRADAEALKAEYEAKSKSADKERKAMLKRAEKEAEDIVAKAASDAAVLVERRTKMAHDKIAAEERQAIADLKAATANAATRAAARLIAQNNDAASDKKLIDAAISGIATS